jgi:hypothetical protein
MAGRRPKGKTRRGRRRWARLLRWIGRTSIRGIRRRIRRVRKGLASVFEAKVVRSYKRDGWRDEFPDPRRREPLVMTKVDPADYETYEALFDGLLTVAFSVSPRSNVTLTDAAREAAETEHGRIAHTWVLTSIEGTNDSAREVLSVLPGGVLKP